MALLMWDASILNRLWAAILQPCHRVEAFQAKEHIIFSSLGYSLLIVSLQSLRNLLWKKIWLLCLCSRLLGVSWAHVASGEDGPVSCFPPLLDHHTPIPQPHVASGMCKEHPRVRILVVTLILSFVTAFILPLIITLVPYTQRDGLSHLSSWTSQGFRWSRHPRTLLLHSGRSWSELS